MAVERNKGRRLNKYVSRYVVFDLETAGTDAFYRNKIVEISALKIEDELVIDTFNMLIDPEVHIPEDASNVNGIYDGDVLGAPKIETALPEFLDFIENEVLIGYNINSFDLNIIYDLARNLVGDGIHNDYIDLMYVAQKAVKGLENYKLGTVSKYFGMDTEGIHRAYKDVCLTKDIYELIYKKYGNSPFMYDKHNSVKKDFTEKSYSDETKRINQLLELLKEIISDGEIDKREIKCLVIWLNNNKDLCGQYPFDRISLAVREITEDGFINRQELNLLYTTILELINPVKLQPEEIISDISGKHCAVTGDFDYGSRAEVTKFIESREGIIDSSVKKATEILIVGSKGSEAWKHGNYGEKIKKAMELKEKGQHIIIVGEEEFFENLNKTEKMCIQNKQILSQKGKDPLKDQTVLWQKKIEEALNEIIKKEELPEKSLRLVRNLKKDKTSVTSYSVCIFEQEYPTLPNEKIKSDGESNATLLMIKESTVKENKQDVKTGILEISVDETQFFDICAEKYNDLKTKKNASDGTNIRVQISKDDERLINFVIENTEYGLNNYSSKAAKFGCCSRFKLCSDAKKCVHPNKIYAHACMYYQHLREGRIFYGKNKNI